MASESETIDIQSVLERLLNSRSRDLSRFIPFLLGFIGTDPVYSTLGSGQNSTDPDRNSSNPSTPDDTDIPNQRDRIILINPLTQGMVVIEGAGLDSLFRGTLGKDGPPPASKSSIEAMPSVEIKEGEEGECVICLEDWVNGETVKAMPCKHKFHGGCIEKWLGLHGSCPVCRFKMPVEEEELKKGEEREEGGERRVQREIWLTFSYGGGRRRTGEESVGGVNGSDSSDSGQQSGSPEDGDQNRAADRGGSDSEMGN